MEPRWIPKWNTAFAPLLLNRNHATMLFLYQAASAAHSLHVSDQFFKTKR